MTGSTHRPRPATTAVTLTLAALVAGVVALALAHAAVAAAQPDRPLAVQDVVNAAVAGLGALVAAWLSWSCGLGALCVAGRVVGAGWRRGERLLRRSAPLVVRRAVAGAVGASLGLGLVATGAHATPVDSAPATVGITHGVGTSGPRTGPDGSAEGVLERPDRRGDASTGAPGTGPRTVVDSRDVGAAPHLPLAPDPASPALAWQVTATDSGADGTTTGGPDGAEQQDTPVVPGWVPTATGDRPTDEPAAARTTSSPDRGAEPRSGATAPGDEPAQRAESAPTTVVVEVGDTLWSIAATQLPADATAADVAAAWPGWFEANRDVIGDDPDLVLPGQRLVAPQQEVAR